MKIAVITANLGNIDPVHPFPKQDYECDRYYITDENNPYPFQDMTPRMAAKYFKMCTHKMLPMYDAYLWLDGQFKIKSPSFVSLMVNHLGSDEIAISKHKQRKTIGEEADFICEQIDKGSAYLKARYSKQTIERELRLIGNRDLPLYMCGLFLRRNTAAVNDLMEQWFEANLLYHCFDQNSFSNYAQQMDLRTVDLGPLYDNDYYSLTKHLK